MQKNANLLKGQFLLQGVVSLDGGCGLTPNIIWGPKGFFMLEVIFDATSFQLPNFTEA